MDRTTRSGWSRTPGADPDDAPVDLLPDDGTTTTVRRATGAAALLALAAAATALAGPWSPPTRSDVDPDDVLEPPPVPSGAPTADPLWEVLRDTDVGDPFDLTWVGLVLLALLVGVVLVGVARLLHRFAERRRGEGAPDAADLDGAAPVDDLGVLPDLPALREGVDDAEEHLRAAVAPADAVIAAWVSLEGAAARSGVVRDPSATPTEFTVAVLDRTAADPAAVRALLALYLRARFGTEPLGAVDVAAATAAVRQLADGLAGGPDDGLDAGLDAGPDDPTPSEGAAR